VRPSKSDLKQIKVVAFDCDGVMFDTRKANRAYYNRLLSRFELPPMTDDQFAYVQQHTVHRSIAHLFQDESMRAQALEERELLSYASFIKEMEIEPDLVFLLEKLRSGFHTAVATNRSNTMNAVLTEHGLAPLFDLVVTALDVMHPKPAPDPLIKVSTHFSVTPGEVFYIGDSKLDEEASLGAGVVFAAYRNPALKADFHIRHLKEVEEILFPSFTIS
jgi:phosphoglycolate phosphatase-like HAD superfamily hydrolase